MGPTRHAVVPNEGGDADACEQCGSTRRSQGVLGLQVCSDCGAVSTFAGELKSVSREVFALPPMHQGGALCPARPKIRVEALPHHRRYSLDLLREDPKRAQRASRCRAAVVLLSDALQLQASLHEPATSLLVRHCQRAGGIPKALPRLKPLVGACILAVSTRQGLGITISEVAARAGLPLNHVQKAVWRVCKVNGLRLWRGPQNVESLLIRICDHFQLSRQRSNVVATANKVMAIANEGWIATGRRWACVVAASFVHAAQAHYYRVDMEDLAKMLAVGHTTIRSRVEEIGKLMLSMLRLLPWGNMVSMRSLHAYLLFVVDHWDLLVPIAPELRKRQLDEAYAAGKRPRAGPAGPARRPRRAAEPAEDE